ncbi:hypothetical protein DFQ05_2197 [Winogradskyella wandonensis]|uniref:Uncharacterized protein n=1 Tax=Winogradskyella wandonensis TaxID=1442586 RepID=A0A4V2PTK8_9FLAO|nr:hypothetical protein [Winogradskyella wandonensis]TCK66911.1 hypothetical protein DFQ05_2197 [Winogradskyella wandonensis]
MSHFKRDLNKEQLLGEYLDTVYNSLNLNFERNADYSLQHRGVDLLFPEKDGIYIDEKAQLDYLNKNLPTFTFELSYLKNGEQKLGWLLDETKLTTHYFLITGIYVENETDLSKGFKNCTITSVNRKKLLIYLESKGLSKNRLLQYDADLRDFENKKLKNEIEELHPKTEGLLYFSPQLAEQPINLQLRLKHLIEVGVAKQIFPLK